MQRKIAGTGSRLPGGTPAVGGSSSASGSGSGAGAGAGSQQSENQGHPSLCLDNSARAHGALGNNQRDGDSGRSDTVRAPARRSMFPLSAPRKKLSFQMPEKGKNSVRAGSVGSFTVESDLIELMPRSHTRHASSATEREDVEGADKMVIHKEIRYSIQYEDEAEVRRREDLKINSVDVSAYV